MSMFGPNGQQVLALITYIPGLSADQVDQVTAAWKRGSPDGRAQAWAQLDRTTSEDERYRILAAASLARREALETARRLRRADWAFWAAACDAGAAVAAGERIGGHYETLVAPFAAAVPALADGPRPGRRQRRGLTGLNPLSRVSAQLPASPRCSIAGDGDVRLAVNSL